MRVIGGFDANHGTRIKLKVSKVGDDVITFAGVLQRFKEDGGGIEAKWSSSQLLSGVSTVLGDAHGYNLVILPVSKAGTNPSMTVDVVADDPPYKDNQAVAVGDNLSFGYRIFVD